MSRELFTDIVIVVNSMASLASVFTGSFIDAAMFALNACVLFQYRVSEETK